MEVKIFGGYISAFRRNYGGLGLQHSAYPMIVKAYDLEHARELLADLCFDKHPEEDGWINHAFDCVEYI